MKRTAATGALRWGKLALSVQLGRRSALFAAADAVLLGSGLFSALLGGGEPRLFYLTVVVLPVLLLGIAALADVVELERRAGSLDLALSLPEVERYFAARVAAVCLPLLAQSWLALLLLWRLNEGSFPLLLALLQPLLLISLVGVSVLFWAERLRSAGAVWLATLVGIALLAPWTLDNPIPRYGQGGGGRLGRGEGMLTALGDALVVTLVTLVLLVSARRRLRDPERLLS
jgi:hypothetical protein